MLHADKLSFHVATVTLQLLEIFDKTTKSLARKLQQLIWYLRIEYICLDIYTSSQEFGYGFLQFNPFSTEYRTAIEYGIE